MSVFASRNAEAVIERAHDLDAVSVEVAPVGLRTLGAVVRTFRTAVRSSFLIPRDDMRRTSVSSSSKSSARNGSFISIQTRGFAPAAVLSFTRGAFLRRDVRAAIIIRIALSWGLLCYTQNLARTRIHSEMSSRSLSSHACTDRRDRRFVGTPRVRLTFAILQPRLDPPPILMSRRKHPTNEPSKFSSITSSLPS